jgi:hypothetical protein
MIDPGGTGLFRPNTLAPSIRTALSMFDVISRPSEAQKCVAYCSYNDYCTSSVER